MAPQKLREAIARQDSIRRTRDRAWIFFAAYLVAALFLWSVAATTLGAPAGGWSAAVFVYIALALVASALAVRSLIRARSQDRRLAAARRSPPRPEQVDEPK